MSCLQSQHKVLIRLETLNWKNGEAGGEQQDSDLKGLEVLLEEADEAVCGGVVRSDLRVVLQLRLDLLRQLLPKFNSGTEKDDSDAHQYFNHSLFSN